MSNLETFAQRELEIIGAFDKDSMYGGMLGEAVMKMVKLFADEGHSGMSANLCVSLFERVARFEPLSPLQGTDDEWTQISDDPDATWQNRRSSHVFKGADGAAYDIAAVIFRKPSGACFQSRDSRRSVTFPYTPKREYAVADGVLERSAAAVAVAARDAREGR